MHATITLAVPIKPKINRKPSKNIPIGDGGPTQIDIGSNVTTIPNTPINITCQATGLPKPDITWYKGGREVNPVQDRSKVLPDGTLVLSESRVDNTGVYTCKATNIDGEDTASTVLTVVRKYQCNVNCFLFPAFLLVCMVMVGILVVYIFVCLSVCFLVSLFVYLFKCLSV